MTFAGVAPPHEEARRRPENSHRLRLPSLPVNRKRRGHPDRFQPETIRPAEDTTATIARTRHDDFRTRERQAPRAGRNGLRSRFDRTEIAAMKEIDDFTLRFYQSSPAVRVCDPEQMAAVMAANPS